MYNQFYFLLTDSQNGLLTLELVRYQTYSISIPPYLLQILCNNPKLVDDPLAYLVDSLIEECQQEHTSVMWENCALRSVGVRALALQYGGVDCIPLNEFFCVPESDSKYASHTIGKTFTSPN